MLASIRKFSKSIFAKIFIAIIALPFVMWGMGDVFRSGKQNVIVEINNEKISSKEFVEHLQKINISKEEMDKIGKTKFLNDALSNYISEKIISIEAKKKGIQLSDEALKEILINDKSFHKDEKFSRTKYERFLIARGYTASSYEGYVRSMELKAQLLNYYSGGINLPNFIIDDLFKKENMVKEIEYINLNEIYSKKIISLNEIDEFYTKNKKLFEERFISFRYIKLTPEILTKKKEFDEDFYKELDQLENDILDGKDFNSIVSNNTSSVKQHNFINERKTYQSGIVEKELKDDFISKIFEIENLNSPEFITLENDYYIAEILNEKNTVLTLKDKDLENTIKAQLSIAHKIEENSKLIERIENKKFNKSDISEMSKKFNVTINLLKINGIEDNKKFNSNFVKAIYEHNSNEIFVMSDTMFQKNYLVRIVKENLKEINKNSSNYKNYRNKANVEYVSKIYKYYDKFINSNYKINVNESVLERLKNSF